MYLVKRDDALCFLATVKDGSLWPNASLQLLPEATARNEWRLEAVSCKALFGKNAVAKRAR